MLAMRFKATATSEPKANNGGKDISIIFFLYEHAGRSRLFFDKFVFFNIGKTTLAYLYERDGRCTRFFENVGEF